MIKEKCFAVLCFLLIINVLQSCKDDKITLPQLKKQATEAKQQKNHKKVIDLYEQIARIYEYDSLLFDSAQFYKIQKLKTMKQLPNANKPKIYFEIGDQYLNLNKNKQAELFFNKSLKANNVDDSISALCYYNRGWINDSLFFYRKTLDIMHKKYKGKNNIKSLAYINLAQLCSNNFDKAEKYIDSALLFLETDNPYRLFEAYLNIGYFYEDYHTPKFMHYTQKALALQQHLGPKDKGLAYNNLANGYSAKSVAFPSYLDTAIHHAKKALHLLKNTPNYKCGILNNLGYMYLAKYLDSSQIFLQKALQCAIAHKDSFHLTIIHSSFGEYWFERKQYTKAIEWFKKSNHYAAFLEEYNYLWIGKSFSKTGNTDSALYYLKKSEKLGGIDVLQWKGKTPGNMIHFSSLNLINCISEVYYQKQQYDTALIYAQAADKLIGFALSARLKTDSNLLLAPLAKRTYANYIQIGLSAGISPEKLFHFCEKSKSSTLLLSIIDLELNEDLKFKPLKQKIIYYKTRAKYDSVNYYLKQYQNVMKASPVTYRQLRSQRAFSLQRIQSELQDSTLLIDYFLSDNVAAVFYIDKNHITRKILDIKKLHPQRLDTFRNYIINSRSKPEQFAKLGYELYTQLLDTTIIQNYKRLIIIPDEKLFNISFEALCTDSMVNNDFKKLPYLLYDYEIIYNYSASLWAYSQKNIYTNSPFSFAAFAPDLKNRQGQKIADTKSIEQFAAYFSNAQCFISTNANKRAFKEHSRKNRILHITTHGTNCRENPNHSSIKLQDSLLYLYEIYNLRLPKSEFLFMHFCQGGSGEFIKGEGMISLLRGFIHAGIPKITHSLWNISKNETQIIADGFYKNLVNRDMNYAKALQQSKISYIKQQNNPILKDWAGLALLSN